MSASPYSLARAFVGVTARCTRSVSFSVLFKIEGNQLLCVRLSQPSRATRLAAPNVPFRNCLRSIARSCFMACSFMLMLHNKPSGHHGTDVVEESRQDYLQYVNDDKPDEGKTGDKVNGPRRLPSTEDREQPRERRIDRWRHCQARQDDQRRHHKQNPYIGQFLQDIVSLGFITFGMPEDNVIFDSLANVTQVLAARSQVARDMSADQCIGREEQAIDNEEPGEEHVPLPSHRQISGARNGSPSREGTARAIRIAEDSCRIELVAQD